MTRFLSVLVTLLAVSGMTLWIEAQDGSPNGQRRPLDLPSGGVGSQEDEEDAPEIISFYGTQFEGDGFFWCLDKSGSMQGNRIATLKQEVTSAIQSLSNDAEIGMVAFSNNTTPWNNVPQKANPAVKAGAVAWVQSLNASGWTCLADAGVQAVQIANQSQKQARRVIIVGDGVPTCNGQNTESQCLADITGANYQGLPIDTLYVANDNAGVSFFQQLSAQNNGTFTQAN